MVRFLGENDMFGSACVDGGVVVFGRVGWVGLAVVGYIKVFCVRSFGFRSRFVFCRGLF